VDSVSILFSWSFMNHAGKSGQDGAYEDEDLNSTHVGSALHPLTAINGFQACS
jgi:hypothetical protein